MGLSCLSSLFVVPGNFPETSRKIDSVTQFFFSCVTFCPGFFLSDCHFGDSGGGGDVFCFSQNKLGGFDIYIFFNFYE